MTLSAKYLTLSLIVLTLFVSVHSFWKTCSQTFCENVRKSPEGYVRYGLDIATARIQDGVLLASLSGPPPTKALNLTLKATDSTFHMVIDEASPTKPRYRVQKALDDENLPKYIILEQLNKTDTTIIVGFETIEARIYGQPFKIEFYKEDQLISVANAQDRFVFEMDTGKTAIAMDMAFPGAQRAYGIPEHADRLSLRSTGYDSVDPYRHFNVDRARYPLLSTESIYGAIPVLYAHATTHTSGVFWLNSAQTWIDIKMSPSQVDAFFMSETGALEVFVLTGPTLAQTVKQYATLTGTAPLPQYFTLGYHQSRYSYMSQKEVLGVVDNFDDNNLPVDVLWLDIDYTEDIKYFTWDPIRFADPAALQAGLSATNRKLVAIIDPHFKVEDPDYFVHTNATAKGYYVKNPNGTVFEGKCWPGLSSYLDFFNPEALNYYASLYSDHHFEGKDIHLWNDMNEPAIFDLQEHENTMPLDAVHHDGWTHRDLHNIYGFYQTIGTRQGLLARQPKYRPFILTRAHFAGIQRYAAIWTGDNHASWEYLQISLPMCLTEALAGVSFCGADVGGFMGIPSDELYQRWYQAGAWLPFYRGHSAIDVPRREPYLFPGDVQARVRTALQQRYAHLPVWYTLFWEHQRTGEPVIRPITYHYPEEADALSIDDQILVGRNILVAPITEAGVFFKSVYLPGGELESWFNIDSYKLMQGVGSQVLQVNLSSVPVFYRGGSIIPRKDTPRPTTVATQNDPYTFYVVLDKDGKAEGTLYADDYESFDYKQKKYLYTGITFADNVLSTLKIDKDADYDGLVEVTRVIVLNPPDNIASAKVVNAADGPKMKISYSDDKSTLTILGFSLSLRQPFSIELS